MTNFCNKVGNTDLIAGFKTDRTTRTNLEMFEKYCPDGNVEAMKANGNFVNKQLIMFRQCTK